mmetsp:Transcript_64/g.78  ORF Transcript_64/g.78 Transcript_64/m.78 type:complete len:83 (-) Transcript_64:1140-1388(-)
MNNFSLRRNPHERSTTALLGQDRYFAKWENKSHTIDTDVSKSVAGLKKKVLELTSDMKEMKKMLHDHIQFVKNASLKEEDVS